MKHSLWFAKFQTWTHCDAHKLHNIEQMAVHWSSVIAFGLQSDETWDHCGVAWFLHSTIQYHSLLNHFLFVKSWYPKGLRLLFGSDPVITCQFYCCVSVFSLSEIEILTCWYPCLTSKFLLFIGVGSDESPLVLLLMGLLYQLHMVGDEYGALVLWLTVRSELPSATFSTTSSMWTAGTNCLSYDMAWFDSSLGFLCVKYLLSDFLVECIFWSLLSLHTDHCCSISFVSWKPVILDGLILPFNT
jgi:hypothetical protein